MFFDERNTIMSNNPSIWEFNKTIYKGFKDYHYVGYDYRKHSPKQYKGKEIPDFKFKEEAFTSSINYVARLFYCCQQNGAGLLIAGLKEIPELKVYGQFIARETAKADQDGELCVYCSVVLYSLLKFFCNICDTHLKFIQGWYQHELRKDFPMFIPTNNSQQGLHSFLCVDGAILDMTIGQEAYFFDFKDEPEYIVGAVPEGMNLWGHEELESTVMKYIRKYASYANLEPGKWIIAHREASIAFMMESLKNLTTDDMERLVDMMVNDLEKGTN